MKVERRVQRIPEMERLDRICQHEGYSLELHASGKTLTVLRVSDGRKFVRAAKVYDNKVRGAARRLLRQLG